VASGRAAGGVVYRRLTPGSSVQVSIVHRPKYDDWSWPKGKLDEGESYEEAALREVEEETGLVCRLERPCGEVSYPDRDGSQQVVRYWLMEPVSGEFQANTEVDELRWVTVAEARHLLTYEQDWALLRDSGLS
jgi:8-oxo-dGTP diphosphatase